MKKVFVLIPFVLLVAGVGYIMMRSNMPVSEVSTGTSNSQRGYVDTQISSIPSSGQSAYTQLSGSISLAEIAKHADARDCWTAIDGSVYDLSSYTSQHPGGPVILSVCGKDGSELFNGKHGEREKKRVESMIIGSLAK